MMASNEQPSRYLLHADWMTLNNASVTVARWHTKSVQRCVELNILPQLYLREAAHACRRCNRYPGEQETPQLRKRLSHVMFLLCYVNFISFHSLSHKLHLLRYSVNNKRLKNKRNVYSLSSFLCYMYAVMAYFHPALSFQREQKHAYSFWRSFCMLVA